MNFVQKRKVVCSSQKEQFPKLHDSPSIMPTCSTLYCQFIYRFRILRPTNPINNVFATAVLQPRHHRARNKLFDCMAARVLHVGPFLLGVVGDLSGP